MPVYSRYLTGAPSPPVGPRPIPQPMLPPPQPRLPAGLVPNGMAPLQTALPAIAATSAAQPGLTPPGPGGAAPPGPEQQAAQEGARAAMMAYFGGGGQQRGFPTGLAQGRFNAPPFLRLLTSLMAARRGGGYPPEFAQRLRRRRFGE
jgi:hypothetical protein